jgi:hypothetical protein
MELHMRKEDLIGICSTSSRTVHADDMCGDVLNTVGYGIRDILVLRSYCGTRLRLAEGAARGRQCNLSSSRAIRWPLPAWQRTRQRSRSNMDKSDQGWLSASGRVASTLVSLRRPRTGAAACAQVHEAW